MESGSSERNRDKLQIGFGLGSLFVYGLGDILGAGIYALVGPVAGIAGSYVWLSFLVALSVAFLTALSYSAMASRFPKSGGASYFALVAFGKPIVGFMVGWLMLFVSIVSMATLARAFSGYMTEFGLGFPDFLIHAGFLGLLGFINFRGIRHSSVANMISTTIEVAGLFIVLYAAFHFFTDKSAAALSAPLSWKNVLIGASLAFYAFIGFEDIANVAEEVKNPRRNLPRAILGSLGAAGALYLAIGYAAVEVAGADALANSPAPLTAVVAKSGLNIPGKLFSFIALFAVANTCLLNYVTASRLLYGMSEQELVPKVFGIVHDSYRTPSIAILAAGPVALLLASLGSIAALAGATAVLILLVFCATNLSLIKVNMSRAPERESFSVPRIIPMLAFVANIGLIALSPSASMASALIISVVGLAIYFIMQKVRREPRLDPALSY